MLLQAGFSSVCFKEASHEDVSFEHKEHTLWQKNSAYWSCIAIFLAEVCLFAQKRRLIETFLLSTQTIRFGGK